MDYAEAYYMNVGTTGGVWYGSGRSMGCQPTKPQRPNAEPDDSHVIC